MRVLITGGAGFVGSNVASALALRHPDWEVVAFDSLHRRGSELTLDRLRSAGVAFIHGDVRQPGDLADAGGFDALLECSAEPSVMAGISGGRDYVVHTNLLGAYHCFEAAARHDAQVIFLSTSRVYPIGALSELPLTETETRFDLPGEGIAEDFPLAGKRTLYGATKLASELLLAEYDLPWAINRCGVIAGPWQMGKVDQGVFTFWVLAHHTGRALQYIGYGGEGKQVRDLIHVDDVVELIDLQLCAPDDWAGQTFNVGGGREISLALAETTALCRELTGKDVPISAAGSDRPGDVRVYLTDASRLYALTGWRPRRSAQTTLEDIARWVHDNETLVRSALDGS
jgi:CDP-paratose 2-epimerase